MAEAMRWPMQSIGWPELLVIDIVFILLFGSKKLPEAAKGLGAAVRDCKAAFKGQNETVKKAAGGMQKAVEKV